MGKKRKIKSVLDKKDSSCPFSSKFRQEDLIKLEKLKELVLEFEDKYKLSFDDLKELVKELSFPSAILNRKLTILESVVKYLKEEKNLSLHKISEVIGRDERNIWNIYNNAGKKYSKRFVIKKVKFWIPVSILADSKLSALESVVAYLKKEFSLDNNEIGKLLERDYRTIWTVYSRAKKKTKGVKK